MAAAATSVVLMDRGNNTTCTVNLHGATVVSWRVNNQEQLFVSKLAVFDGKKPIRGGIPFVFPQFGPWSFGPQHGFGRLARWALERSPERLPSGDVEAVFSLMDNDFTRSMWNYPFRITYRLILREKELHFHIGVYNPSKEITFSFNLLLHTYLKVPDVRKCQITGLHGCTFIDKTRDGTIYQEGRDVVTVNEWTDRVYQHTPQEHIVTNVVSGRKMRIQKYNFPDTVIWNPWHEKAREMSDFGDDEYPNMICVEAGHVSSPVILLPGTAFEASQILQVSFVNGVSGGKPRRSKKNANANNNNNSTNSGNNNNNNNNNVTNNSGSVGNNSSNNSLASAGAVAALHHPHPLAAVSGGGVPPPHHHHPVHHHHHHPVHHHLHPSLVDANNLNILNNNHNFR